MSKYLKFTGNFRDLKKLGFHFQKMYAANYRCYTDYSDNNLLDEYPFWIWQKGREIEIHDWYGLTAPVLEYIQTHELIPRTINHPKFKSTIDYFTLICNRKTHEVREKTRSDDPLNIYFMRKDNKISEEECQRLINELKKSQEDCREIIVSPTDLFKKFEVLKGMYEIAETK